MRGKRDLRWLPKGIRNLARPSAKAARETTEFIEDSVKNVGNGTKLANVTAKVLEQIANGVAKVTDLVGIFSK